MCEALGRSVLKLSSEKMAKARWARLPEAAMFVIRAVLRQDTDLHKTLINGVGKYGRLPVAITEKTLAWDGFGPRQESRVLIADLDNQPSGLRFLFQLLFHVSRP
jgi:hypothetical protein